jgi:hypothetical protein
MYWLRAAVDIESSKPCDSLVTIDIVLYKHCYSSCNIHNGGPDIATPQAILIVDFPDLVQRCIQITDFPILYY